MTALLEKVAANRLGKEVLKKWLANAKGPSAQAFHNRVVDSLAVNAPRHPKATGIDRVKFLARGGDEAVGPYKAKMPTPKVAKPKVSQPAPKHVEHLKIEPKKIPSMKIDPAKSKAQAANDNTYLRRIGMGVAMTGGAVAVGGGAALAVNKFKKKKAA